jgi:hypothetical protein
MIKPLDGIWQKYNWALTQTQKLRDYFESIQEADGYTIQFKYDPKCKKYVFRTRDIVEVDPATFVAIGNIIHNLRSALDNVAWALASQNSSHPSDFTAFPIHLVGRTRVKIKRGKRRRDRPSFWGRNRGDGLSQLESVHQKHIQMIEAFQPYKRRYGGRRDPLWLLHKLNNFDKHRIIQAAATRIWATEGTIINPNNIPVGALK